jgi:hypothetical protein
MVLKDAEKWHPGLKEEVKDKETGETQVKPVDFEKYMLRSIWRAVTTLTRGERYDPEKPPVITNVGVDPHTGETTENTPFTDEAIKKRIGESSGEEDAQRKELADQWMGAFLDKAGMEVYDARTRGEPLDMLRKKYGDEAVAERHKMVDDLLPYFRKWISSGYEMPSEAGGTMPKLTTPAKNVLPIRKILTTNEKRFLRQFTAGMSPEQAQAAHVIYRARRGGLRIEDIAGHDALPAGYKYIHQTRPLSSAMSKAAQKFSQKTGNDVWTGIEPRRKGEERQVRQVYIPEIEHHAGIEQFMRPKLVEAGLPEAAMKVLQQTMMGTRMPKRLHEDKELTKLAEQKYLTDRAKYGKNAGRKPTSAKSLVNTAREAFKRWLPEYFESVERPDLAQAYREKYDVKRAQRSGAAATTLGKRERMSPEERRKGVQRANKMGVAALRSREKKTPIDREPLKLDTLPEKLERAFTEVRRGRSNEDLKYGKDRARLAMAIVAGKLEGETVPQILKKPEVARIVATPGLFRRSEGQRTDAMNLASTTALWNAVALPIIQEHSPALYTLLTKHYKNFRKEHYPLSQVPEVVEPE